MVAICSKIEISKRITTTDTNYSSYYVIPCLSCLSKFYYNFRALLKFHHLEEVLSNIPVSGWFLFGSLRAFAACPQFDPSFHSLILLVSLAFQKHIQSILTVMTQSHQEATIMLPFIYMGQFTPLHLSISPICQICEMPILSGCWRII